MRLFIGMAKGTNMFILGECLEEGSVRMKLRHVVRVFEIPNGQQQISYQFHPDPYFSGSSESYVVPDDYSPQRIETDAESKVVLEYQKFLTHMRMQNSGLVAGNLNPAQSRKNLEV
jgi:hypothetical protein